MTNSIITKRVIRSITGGRTDSIITKKEKGQRDKQRSTNHYQKTKDRAARNPTQIRGWTQLHDLLIYVAGLCTCMHLIMLNDLDGLFAVLYCAMMNLYITFKNLHKGNAWWIFRNNCTDEVFKTAVVLVIVW